MKGQSRLVIHDVWTANIRNLRTLVPEEPGFFDERVVVSIGTKRKKGSDDFVIRVATPASLAEREEKGAVAESPLLILDRYDYEVLWAWLEQKVGSCEADTWEASVHCLRRYFDWEYEDYQW